MPFLPEPPYPHDSIPRVGILLVNLGTPAAPTAPALRRYLKEFLSDPRVVEIPRPLWTLILHGFVLRTRPKKSAARYASVWTPDGSPLIVYSQRVAQRLKGFLGQRTRAPLAVALGMRYGAPSIADALAELKAQHCDRILLLPMYPQYAASTTGSAFDALAAALAGYRNLPALRTVRQYHDHPAYIAALAASVENYWFRHGRPDKLVMSFHGVPRFALDAGDPYHCACLKTGRLVAEKLGLAKERHLVTFQSRFGRAKWLEPYTAPTLVALAREGVARVDVICPGFAVDCLETLEEIAIEARDTFLKAGGKEFEYIPCLNDGDGGVNALAEVALDELQGWLDPVWDAAAAKSNAAQTLARAKSLGAAS